MIVLQKILWFSAVFSLVLVGYHIDYHGNMVGTLQSVRRGKPQNSMWFSEMCDTEKHQLLHSL